MLVFLGRRLSNLEILKTTLHSDRKNENSQNCARLCVAIAAADPCGCPELKDLFDSFCNEVEEEEKADNIQSAIKSVIKKSQANDGKYRRLLSS